MQFCHVLASLLTRYVERGVTCFGTRLNAWLCHHVVILIFVQMFSVSYLLVFGQVFLVSCLWDALLSLRPWMSCGGAHNAVMLHSEVKFMCNCENTSCMYRYVHKPVIIICFSEIPIFPCFVLFCIYQICNLIVLLPFYVNYLLPMNYVIMLGTLLSFFWA